MEKKQEEKNTEKVKKRTSLKNIIGGDILATDFFRRQAGLLFLIMVLIIIYINNRYECQLQLIEIDNLKKELIDIKYDALTANHASRNTSPPKKAICRLPLIHRTY
jgi:hypothetical protein